VSALFVLVGEHQSHPGFGQGNDGPVLLDSVPGASSA